jgi:hypothetical protein
MTCERCLRSIGLWLYKRESNQIESEQKATSLDDASKETDNDLNLVFANTEPYSDEIVIQNVMNKLVNSVDLEHESDLLLTNEKNSADDHREITYPIKKRKLNEIEAIASSSPFKKVARTETASTFFDKIQGSISRKVFDPIAEHFHWCPWVCESVTSGVEESKLISLIQECDSQPHSLKSRKICQSFSNLLKKFLSTRNNKIELNSKLNRCLSVSKANILNNSIKSSEEQSEDTQHLSERVKSIKSLLINCTTHFSN